jgi:thiol-disulfide isomerase/thioredoxin
MIVEFYADWCHVCQSIQKPFELVARDPAFKSIRFVQVDMEKHPTLSKKYNVLGFPTFIYFKKGKNIKQDMGVHNIADFKNELSTTIRKQFRLAENTAHKS